MLLLHSLLDNSHHIPKNKRETRTSRLSLSFSSFSRFAFSSWACFFRSSLRLWNPVRYSSRAAKSNSIFSGAVTASLRFLFGGPMMAKRIPESSSAWCISG
jgi:hypothetical protein